jgi:hypothetical protein
MCALAALLPRLFHGLSPRKLHPRNEIRKWHVGSASAMQMLCCCWTCLVMLGPDLPAPPVPTSCTAFLCWHRRLLQQFSTLLYCCTRQLLCRSLEGLLFISFLAFCRALFAAPPCGSTLLRSLAMLASNTIVAIFDTFILDGYFVEALKGSVCIGVLAICGFARY